MNAAETQIYCRLGQANGFSAISDISSPVNYAFLYIQYGQDGIETGSPEGVYDYIRATAGTSFELTGLSTKAWVPVDGTTLEDVVNDIMDILINGNY
jgi:hypothetical protein